MSRPIFAAALAVTLGLASNVSAEPTKPLGKHGGWETYAYTEKGEKVCYMISSPTKSQGADKSRATTAVTITHRGAQTNVFSVLGGYQYKKDSDVELEVGAAKFKLFTQGDGAWARDAATDSAIVKAIFDKASTLVVKGTPAKGAPTVDSYSLQGFTPAYVEIKKACGVK